MQHNPYTYIDCELFLNKLRRYSESLQRARSPGSKHTPRSAGLYALVVELLTMYAQQRLTVTQLVAGLQGALRDHKPVAAALTALLQSIHENINMVRTMHTFCLSAQSLHCGRACGIEAQKAFVTVDTQLPSLKMQV
jgi:hypothetical protein